MANGAFNTKRAHRMIVISTARMDLNNATGILTTLLIPNLLSKGD